MALEYVEQCPLCSQTSFLTHLVCEDFLSSHEYFDLKKCKTCSFIFTSPRPDSTSLPLYYESNQYVSHSGKPTGIINSLYLIARKFTLRWKVGVIEGLRVNPHLLDFGCGTGELLHACQQKGWSVSGVEQSATARQKATSITGINIAENLGQLSGQQFDVITLWHVMEHIVDLRKTLSTLKSLLKNDGRLLLAVPNCESYDATLYQEYWAGYDVPRHVWHFTKATMSGLLNPEALAIETIKPMRLDSYYVSLLSEKYKSSKRPGLMAYVNGFRNGFLSNRKARNTLNHSSLLYVIRKK